MSFVSVLETIGKGFAKGLQWAVESWETSLDSQRPLTIGACH